MLLKPGIDLQSEMFIKPWAPLKAGWMLSLWRSYPFDAVNPVGIVTTGRGWFQGNPLPVNLRATSQSETRRIIENNADINNLPVS